MPDRFHDSVIQLASTVTKGKSGTRWTNVVLRERVTRFACGKPLGIRPSLRHVCHDIVKRIRNAAVWRVSLLSKLVSMQPRGPLRNNQLKEKLTDSAGEHRCRSACVTYAVSPAVSSGEPYCYERGVYAENQIAVPSDFTCR